MQVGIPTDPEPMIKDEGEDDEANSVKMSEQMESQ